MYKAPVDDILFTLTAIAGFPSLLDQRFPDLDADTAAAILTEAGRFASDEIAPLAAIGDAQGARLAEGEVRVPDGWADLYHRWIAGGWNGLTAPESFGGQDLPHMLNVAALEMWNSGAMAFALCPTLTMGAVEALDKHGSEQLKALYLAKMVSGEWTGTMNLTEPQAGSDLSQIKTRAERHADGSYRIFGQKIYITWGDHEVTDNIVHLVLARLADAPEGTRGISLFLVPKYLLNADGSPGIRNDLLCHALEHKLGIHASPTCTMIFGDEQGAVGYLIGEENRGLACMFTMMNNARLAVAMQGVAIAEAATQKALAFAQERRQSGQAIVHHPDVARMLLTMKVLTFGARAISYACAHAIDSGHGDRAGLLTPIAKAFATDIGVEVASLGIQVHGGMGYVEETGAARLLRDARIAPIYEGTNGIQAIDLVTRKLPLSGGEAARGFIAELRAVSQRTELTAALDHLTEATEWLLSALESGQRDAALFGATPYLRLFGLTLTGIYLAKAADVDANRNGLYTFFAANLLRETSSLSHSVIHGADDLAAALSSLEPA
ncbi:acyl-CoA dehydrogenase [Rhizobium sp. CFBP 8762]|uniref:acyl-CoA dehydrogenase n=1 Tax=Rhizobium sp. CFBP 8762 TaxID=2775279 RepID=UPI00178000C9|nr:acyl-CoA dehydrogenase [Rhizobium sp. CFBP 8762]MBD8553288.1 acyl-CoA dehydrogenase [Rhizobium sp. CFBP 8762]